MHVVVTGSSGRVGREVSRQLLEAGHAVVGLDLQAPAGEQPHGLRFIRSDLLDPSIIEPVVAEADVVVHLAAFMSWNKADAAKLFSANVTTGFTLLQAFGPATHAQLIVASSGEVYPEGAPHYLPIDENHPREPRSHYGMNKLLLEEMTWFVARAYGVPATVIRLPHTQDATELLDPSSPFSGPRFFLRRKIAQQEVFGNQAVADQLRALDNGREQLLLSRGENGDAYCMPIGDTRDTAAGIVAAVTRPDTRGHTIALGPQRSVDFVDALRRMSELTGLPVVEACLPGTPVAYDVDISLAKKLLGYQPRYDFEAMVTEAAEAYHRRTAA